MQSSELGRFGPYVSGSELVCRKLGRFGPYNYFFWGPKRLGVRNDLHPVQDGQKAAKINYFPFH